MTAERLRQQNELNSLLTYFYRGHHHRLTWTPAEADIHPQLITIHLNQQQHGGHHHHTLVQWHFIAKPPRLKNHQRQPLQWSTPPALLKGNRRRQINNGFRCRSVVFVGKSEDEDVVDCCGGNVPQKLTCEWLSRWRLRPKEELPLLIGGGGSSLVRGHQLHFVGEWWTMARTMTLTCFVVGRSLFFVRLDLKWFSLSVEFRQTNENGQRTVVVDRFKFDVVRWEELRQLVWRWRSSSGKMEGNFVCVFGFGQRVLSFSIYTKRGIKRAYLLCCWSIIDW